MDEADRLSDRVAIIDHGRILTMDSPEALKNKSGFGDILQIRLSDPDEQKVRSWMKSLPEAFTEKKYSDGLLLLGGTDLPGLIPRADSMLKSGGFNVIDITVRKCTLEDVFISMTGRGLRE
jgi:ABC-2 type transport system ATP-binding protein